MSIQEMQKTALEKIFGSKINDVLIPQKLISPKHLKPRIARNAVYNYLNTKPQWKSLQEQWNDLEDHIWKLGLQVNIFVAIGTFKTILPTCLLPPPMRLGKENMTLCRKPRRLCCPLSK